MNFNNDYILAVFQCLMQIKQLETFFVKDNFKSKTTGNPQPLSKMIKKLYNETIESKKGTGAQIDISFVL